MESTQSPSQQTPPASPRPRLERLRDDRAVAGVASGLARYLDIDVAWVRIAFVIAALFGGTGVLLYLVGWVAIPEEGQRESIAVDKVKDLEGSGSWIGLGLIVLAVAIIVGNTGLIDGDVVFAAALIAFGVMLYRGDIGGKRGSNDSVGHYEAPPSYEAAGTPGATASTPAETGAMEPATYENAFVEPVSPPLDPDPAFLPQPREPREPSPLGRFAIATLLIVLGVIGLGQVSGWWAPSPRQYAAAVFVVLGTALVVSSLFGRARWIIVMGLLLSPMLFSLALLRVPFEGGFGDPHYTPQSATELNEEYRLVGGELVLDLTSVEVAAGEVYTIDASVVFGRLEIVVPPDLGVEVDARVDMGEMQIDGGERVGGVSIERTVSFAGSGLVTVDAHVGFGELVVHEIEEGSW